MRDYLRSRYAKLQHFVMTIEHSLQMMRTLILDRPLVVETMSTILVLIFLLVLLPYYLLCGCRRRPNGRWTKIGALRVERVRKGARLPTRPTQGSLGFDLYAACGGTVSEGTGLFVPTGLRFAIPQGHAGLLFVNELDKGSHAKPFSFTRVDQIIYPDSQSEILVVVTNRTKETYKVRQGDVVAHLLIQPVSMPKMVEGRLEGMASGGLVMAIHTIKKVYSLCFAFCIHARTKFLIKATELRLICIRKFGTQKLYTAEDKVAQQTKEMVESDID